MKTKQKIEKRINHRKPKAKARDQGVQMADGGGGVILNEEKRLCQAMTVGLDGAMSRGPVWTKTAANGAGDARQAEGLGRRTARCRGVGTATGVDGGRVWLDVRHVGPTGANGSVCLSEPKQKANAQRRDTVVPRAHSVASQ